MNRTERVAVEKTLEWMERLWDTDNALEAWAFLFHGDGYDEFNERMKDMRAMLAAREARDEQATD